MARLGTPAVQRSLREELAEAAVMDDETEAGQAEGDGERGGIYGETAESRAPAPSTEGALGGADAGEPSSDLGTRETGSPSDEGTWERVLESIGTPSNVSSDVLGITIDEHVKAKLDTLKDGIKRCRVYISENRTQINALGQQL